MKKVILFSLAITLACLVNAQIKLESDGGVQLGSQTNNFRTGTNPKYGQALYKDLNSSLSYGGVMMENGLYESAGIYFDEDYAVIWSPGDRDRLLRVYDEDYMSGSSYEKWYIDGDGDAYKASDARSKENVITINSPLEKIKLVNGVRYNFIHNEQELKKSTEVSSSENKEVVNKTHLGFLAQDLEKVFPELVQTNEAGSKFVNYEGMIPVLVESIKELQVIIENQDKEIKMLKEGQNTTSINTLTLNNGLKLYQNTPNPFSENTEIKYYLPESVVSANMYIYDMSGKQLKNVVLNQRGDGSITVKGGEFNAGMYIYAMVADGQTIGNKRMILTE
jgi:hypothetical protein